MSSIFDTTVPAGAFDAFEAQASLTSAQQRVWTPDDGPLPSLYISHGAPPLLDDPEWMDRLFRWAQSMPKPQAVLIVSAHWEAAPLMLSATDAATPLVYDFGGFDRRYYELTYPTPDASALARQVAGVMPAAEPVHQHTRRGLDHGAWVPLKVMYPNADVPVLQLSIPTHDPDKLIELGRRLRPLRDEGVLVIGSGFMTHGLPYLTREMVVDNVAPGWSRDFDSWAAERLAAGDVDGLASYRSQAPGVRYAHPTVDHYVPLFVTLGAASDAEQPAETVMDGFKMGLARRSLQLA